MGVLNRIVCAFMGHHWPRVVVTGPTMMMCGRCHEFRWFDAPTASTNLAFLQRSQADAD